MFSALRRGHALRQARRSASRWSARRCRSTSSALLLLSSSSTYLKLLPYPGYAPLCHNPARLAFRHAAAVADARLPQLGDLRPAVPGRRCWRRCPRTTSAPPAPRALPQRGSTLRHALRAGDHADRHDRRPRHRRVAGRHGHHRDDLRPPAGSAGPRSTRSFTATCRSSWRRCCSPRLHRRREHHRRRALRGHRPTGAARRADARERTTSTHVYCSKPPALGGTAPPPGAVPAGQATCASSSPPRTAWSARSTASPSPSSAARTLGIVGESGSGKSVTSLAILGLHNPKRHAGSSGEILLGGREPGRHGRGADCAGCAAATWR